MLSSLRILFSEKVTAGAANPLCIYRELQRQELLPPLHNINMPQSGSERKKQLQFLENIEIWEKCIICLLLFFFQELIPGEF